MRRVRLCALSAALVVVAASLAAAQAPAAPKFTVDELLKLARVSDPQLSPDGRAIVYVVTDVSLAKNSRTNHLWLVPVAGGEPIGVARSDKGEDTPRWSPDGRSLAFVSARDGSSQVWLVAMGPGGATSEPRKLTSLATEAGGIAWSPDGKWIVFASDVYPQCTTIECDEAALKDFTARPSRARVFDHLMFRHWVAWKEGRVSHLFLVPSDGSATPRDITPGAADVPPFSLSAPPAYAFSPDSKELAFVRKTDPVEAISTNSDLFLLDIADPAAKPRQITTNPAADDGPTYSPDGRFIAYRSQKRPGFEADRWEVLLYDRRTGERRSVTAGWDRSADSILWTADSKALYLTAEDQGTNAVFSVALAGGAPARLPLSGSNSDVQITPDGRTLVFAHSSLSEPVEIFRAAADGAGVQAVTHASRGLAAFGLRPAETVWFEGADGVRIHALLVKPADFDASRKYPLLYLVHGGPQNSWSDGWSYRWNPQVLAAAGYVVIMPNPHGSTGFGQAFTDEISGDWGGKVYEDLMKGVDFAEALPYVEKGRTGAAGASFGGYMMDWFLGHTTRFRAILTHAGVFNVTSMYGVTEELWFPEWDLRGTPWTSPELYAKFSPHMYAKNFKTPTLVTHGELDFRVPIGEGLQLFTTLQRQGVPSKMIYFPDEGHWINKPANSALWYREFVAWMDHWVKGN